jgi:hypothetical protein
MNRIYKTSGKPLTDKPTKDGIEVEEVQDKSIENKKIPKS